MSLSHNYLFPASQLDKAFQLSHKCAMVFLNYSFSDGTFISFETMQKNWETQNTLFRFLEACSFTRGNYPFYTFLVRKWSK